jgi:small subunit ribosomal protein S20
MVFIHATGVRIPYGLLKKIKAKKAMANHKSTLRRIRSDKSKTLNNKYYHKTMRNSLRDLRAEEDKSAAQKEMSSLVSKIDKLAKRGVIHKNKAANIKSKLSKKIAAL